MRRSVLIAWLMTAACGLDVGGLAQQPDADTDGEPPISIAGDVGAANAAGDGASAEAARADSGGMDATPASGEGGSTCATVPSGWNLALYQLGNNSCPPRFTAHDVSGKTTFGNAACSCTCTVTQPGSCSQGQLSVNYGSGGSPCDMPTWSATFNGPSCTALGSSVMVSGMPSNVATPLAPQGGACTQASHADSSQLSTAYARYCEVPADSAAAVCAGTVPSGFAACIVTNGETACPSGTPFAQKYVVEDHASLACAPCSGGCSLTTTCSNATVTGFVDSMCKTRLGTAVVDGTCQPVMFYASLPATLVAVEYTATATSTCTAGSSTPSAQLTNPHTICCR